MARDTTGLAGYGHPTTDLPTDTLRVTRPARGDSVLTPIRRRGTSIRAYREAFDSKPHTVVVWRPSGDVATVYRTCGAVSAAVVAHTTRGVPNDEQRPGEPLVTVYPSDEAPSREQLQRMRVMRDESGALVTVEVSRDEVAR